MQVRIHKYHNLIPDIDIDIRTCMHTCIVRTYECKHQDKRACMWTCSIACTVRRKEAFSIRDYKCRATNTLKSRNSLKAAGPNPQHPFCGGGLILADSVSVRECVPVGALPIQFRLPSAGLVQAGTLKTFEAPAASHT